MHCGWNKAARVKGAPRGPEPVLVEAELTSAAVPSMVAVGGGGLAGTFHRMCEAGLNGMAFGLVNYLQELPYIAEEVLPRMVRLGIRQV